MTKTITDRVKDESKFVRCGICCTTMTIFNTSLILACFTIARYTNIGYMQQDQGGQNLWSSVVQQGSNVNNELADKLAEQGTDYSEAAQMARLSTAKAMNETDAIQYDLCPGFETYSGVDELEKIKHEALMD